MLEAAPAAAAVRRWALARPDVYSIRHTTREDAVEPVVHEIKVSRADLLSDLRHADKRAAYVALSSQCWYVLRAGIAEAAEIPPEFGVLVAPTPGDGLPPDSTKPWVPFFDPDDDLGGALDATGPLLREAFRPRGSNRRRDDSVG